MLPLGYFSLQLLVAALLSLFLPRPVSYSSVRCRHDTLITSSIEEGRVHLAYTFRLLSVGEGSQGRNLQEPEAETVQEL